MPNLQRKWKYYLIWSIAAAIAIVVVLILFPKKGTVDLPSILSNGFLLTAFLFSFHYILDAKNLKLTVGWGFLTYGILLNLLKTITMGLLPIIIYLAPFFNTAGIVLILWGLYVFTNAKVFEERYKTLFEHSNDAILLMKSNEMVDCNPKAVELFGCDKEQLLGKTIDSLSSPEQLTGSDQYGILKNLYLACQGNSQLFEWRFLRCDGSAFEAEISMSEFRVNEESFVQLIIRDISGRKATERALLEERKRYRALFDNNDAVIMKNLKTGQMEFNAKVAEMLGYSVKELQKIEFDKIVPHDELEILKKKLELLVERGYLPIFEMTFIKRDGAKIPVEINVSLVKNDKGEPIYLQSVIRDISHRNKALEAIKAERDRTKKYFHSAGVIMIIIDPKGCVVDINQKGCIVLGYEREEIIGENWFENFIPKRIRERVREVFASIDAESYGYFENPILTKSGEERLIGWHNTHLKDEEGRIIGTLSSGEDITKRRKFEKKLLESEEKFRTLVNSMEDFVFTLDRNLRITGLYGRRWVREFGLKRTHDYLGKTVSELYGRNEATHIEANRKVLEGETQVYEWPMVKDGKQVYFQTKLSPLYDFQGDVVGIVGIARDIPQLKTSWDLLQRWVKFHRLLLETFTKILQGDFEENPFTSILRRCIHMIPGTQAGRLLLKENDEYKYVAAIGYDLKKLRQVRFTPEELLHPEIYSVFVIKDFKHNYALNKKHLNTLLEAGKLDKLKATLFIPVIINNELRVLFNLDTMESPDVFDNTTIEMAEILGKTVGLLLERLEFEQTLKEQREKLVFSSTHDTLTHLPNRRFLFEHASQQLALAKRHGKSLSVLYMDLDKFKKVNDTFGHEFGDELLKKVADRLKALLRESDVVARLGGDEFVFLLPDTDAFGALETTKRLIMNLEKPFKTSKQELKISASFGISIFPSNGNDLKELLRKADQAMYQAKKNNKLFHICDEKKMEKS